MDNLKHVETEIIESSIKDSNEKDIKQIKMLELLRQNPTLPDLMITSLNSLLKTTRIIKNEPYRSVRQKRRKRNMQLAKASTLLGLAKHPLGLPYELMIEPTNLCNLTCPLCPTGNGTMNRKQGHMKLEHFKNIIDQLEDEVRRVIFWGFGEPFIPKKAVEMIRYASDKKMFVLTSTNGTLLNNPTLAEEIVNSGLQTLYVALDGLSQETLSKYRNGADIKDILAGVRLIKNKRNKMNLSTPELVLQFVITRENEHELDQLEAFFENSAFDKWSVKKANIMATSDTIGFDDLAEKYIPDNEENTRFKRTAKGKLRIRGEVLNRCRILFEQTMINWDGTMIPCCWDAQSEYIFGNVLEEDFQKIWFGENYTNFRKKVYTNRHQIQICRDCPTDRTETKLSRQFTKKTTSKCRKN